MLGMLQIITYLLCVYLIFKGIEIYQIANSSAKENNHGPLVLGIVMIVISIIAAAGFALWVTSFAESVGNNMPTLPRSR